MGFFDYLRMAMGWWSTRVSQGCVHGSDFALTEVQGSDFPLTQVRGSDRAVWTVTGHDEAC